GRRGHDVIELSEGLSSGFEACGDVGRRWSVVAVDLGRGGREANREAWSVSSKERSCLCRCPASGCAQRPPERHLGVKRRLPEAARAAIGLNRAADMAFGLVNALPAGGADQRVVVQCADDGGATRAAEGWQLEREIEQVVAVKDIGPGGIHH